MPGTGFVATGSGLLQVPSASFTGECADSNYVLFEQSVSPPQPCLRSLYLPPTPDGKAAFTAQCVGDFSVQRYVSNLWLARTADITSAAALAGSGGVPNAVPITVTRVTYMDFLTGVATDATATYLAQGCATKAHGSIARCVRVEPPSTRACAVCRMPFAVRRVSFVVCVCLFLHPPVRVPTPFRARSYGASKAGCKFTSTLSATNVDPSASICQGFVTGVTYTIQVRRINARFE